MVWDIGLLFKRVSSGIDCYLSRGWRRYSVIVFGDSSLQTHLRSTLPNPRKSLDVIVSGM